MNQELLTGGGRGRRIFFYFLLYISFFLVPPVCAAENPPEGAFVRTLPCDKKRTADDFVSLLAVEYDGSMEKLHLKFEEWRACLEKNGAVISIFLDEAPEENEADTLLKLIALWQGEFPAIRVLWIDRTKNAEGDAGAWKTFVDKEKVHYLDLIAFRNTVSAITGFPETMDQELITPTLRVLQGESELNDPVLPKDKSDWTIVISPEASELEKNAARELQYFHARAFGVTPEITTIPQTEKNYFFRCVPGTGGSGGHIGWRAVSDGLVMEGDATGGVLYVVYEFAEKILTVNLFSATEVEFPEIQPEPDLWSVAPLTYDSPFAERTALYLDMARHHRFAARMRNNGFLYKGDAAWGFTSPYAIEIHSFDRILPAATWLETHPEFFSLRDGKRVGGQLTGQLCLTNQEMKQAFIKEVLKQLRQTPDAKRISISQNDNMFVCQCNDCLASDAAYGGPGGTLLRFVNGVAEAVEREFPEIEVETFAYQYTTRPPQQVTARENVTVRLCSIGCDFSKPLDSEGNELFQKEIQGWGKVAPRLTIWNYVANFSNQFAPFPNFTNVAGDLRMFRNYGAKSVVEQGAWNNGIAADFAILRAWVISHLLWNPDLDANRLIAEFMTAYYGDAAGNILLEYWQDREQTIQERKPFLHCFAMPRSYLATGDLWRWLEMAERAEKAAVKAENPVQLERVRLAVAPVRLAAFLRADRLQRQYGIAPQLQQMAAQVFSVVERNDPENFSESGSWISLRSELEKMVSTAQQVEFLPEKRAEDGDSTGKIFIPAYGLSGTRVQDPAAVHGEAIREPGTLYNWSIQLHPDADFAPFVPGKYFARVLARSEGPGVNGDAFEFGYYNMKTAQQESRHFPQKIVRSPEYHWYELGNIPLTPECYLFIAPIRNDDMSYLYIAGIELTPQPQSE